MPDQKPILLIEDNPGDARLLQLMLSEAGGQGFLIEWVSRLETGLEKLRTRRFSAVLLDLSLPDSEGVETIQKVSELVSDIPIVILTGFEDEILAIKALRSGAEDYLIKGQTDGNMLVRSLKYAIERKELVSRLWESENQTRLLADHISDVIWKMDLNYRFTYITPGIQALLGYTQNEAINLDLRKLISPATVGRLENLIENDIKNIQKPHNDLPRMVDLELIHKNGDRIWSEVKLSYIFDAHGTPNGVIGVSRDITTRHHAELALRLSEERMRLAADHFPYTFVIYDNLRRIVFANRHTIESGHFSSEQDLIGKKDEEIYPPAATSVYIPLLDKVIETKKIQSAELTLPFKGAQTTALITCVPILDENQDLRQILGISIDITSRRIWEEELKISHARYQAIVEDQMELVCRFLPDGILTFANTAYCQYFKKPLNQLIGQKFTPQIIESDRELVDQMIASLCFSKPVVTYEYRVYNPEGEVRWQQWTDRAIFNDAGQLVEYQSVGRDISEQKRSEDALRKANEALHDLAIHDPLTGLHNRRYLQERLETILRSFEDQKSPVGVIMIDIDHFKGFNDSYGHAAGDTLLNQLGKLLISKLRPDDFACRYGGEEFVLILPHASLIHTTARAEELCARISELQVNYKDQSLGRITVSIGTSAFPEDGTDIDALLRAADIALYQAKERGRNQVVMYKPG